MSKESGSHNMCSFPATHSGANSEKPNNIFTQPIDLMQIIADVNRFFLLNNQNIGVDLHNFLNLKPNLSELLAFICIHQVSSSSAIYNIDYAIKEILKKLPATSEERVHVPKLEFAYNLTPSQKTTVKLGVELHTLKPLYSIHISDILDSEWQQNFCREFLPYNIKDNHQAVDSLLQAVTHECKKVVHQLKQGFRHWLGKPKQYLQMVCYCTHCDANETYHWWYLRMWYMHMISQSSPSWARTQVLLNATPKLTPHFENFEVIIKAAGMKNDIIKFAKALGVQYTDEQICALLCEVNKKKIYRKEINQSNNKTTKE
jgi:hypothetical protein